MLPAILNEMLLLGSDAAAVVAARARNLSYVLRMQAVHRLAQLDVFHFLQAPLNVNALVEAENDRSIARKSDLVKRQRASVYTRAVLADIGERVKRRLRWQILLRTESQPFRHTQLKHD